MDDSDADLYAEFHGGKMTPESTSSSEGSYISISRSLERRSKASSIERYHDSDMNSSINTDFAALPPCDLQADQTRGFDFQVIHKF